MNPKIFVGAAVAGIAIVIAVIATSGSSLVSEFSDRGLSPQDEVVEIKPVEIEVQEINILDLTDKGATIELVVKVTNPNPKSIILQIVKYQIFENGQRITAGQIGDRPEGMVDASNYYTILGESSIILKDKFSLKNSGSAPEFWNSLESGDLDWTVTGEAFFNLSSITSGQENEVFFEQQLIP